MDLLPLVAASNPRSSGRIVSEHGLAPYVPRSKVLGFDCTGGQHTVIDNNWKLVHNPGTGQCDFQPPYSTWENWSSYGRNGNIYMLFDLDTE